MQSKGRSVIPLRQILYCFSCAHFYTIRVFYSFETFYILSQIICIHSPTFQQFSFQNLISNTLIGCLDWVTSSLEMLIGISDHLIWNWLIFKAMHNEKPMELVFSSNYTCPQNVWMLNIFTNTWDKKSVCFLWLKIIIS